MKTKTLACLFLALATSAWAQFTNINLGTTANDGTGDNLRSAGAKMNGNFALASNLFKATPADVKSASVGLTNETIVVPTNSSLLFIMPNATNVPGKHMRFYNPLGVTNTTVRYTNGLIVWDASSSTNRILTNAGQSLDLYAFRTNWLAR
jgi:hypothetical protein